MKGTPSVKLFLAALIAVSLATITNAEPPRMKMTTPIPASVTAPDKVETSIGTLEYFDGVPTEKTVETVYDYLDRSRAVEAFMNCLPAVSMNAIREAQQSAGAVQCNQICIFDDLMDSKTILLTGNTSTMYALGFLDLSKDGPCVIDLPVGMLGILDDMFFQYMTDLGLAGPDKGKGGKYLVLPPGYKGEVPEGYFVVQSKTSGVWVFMRGYLDKDLPLEKAIPKASKNIRDTLKVYPLSTVENPPTTEFINVSGKVLNFVVPNDYSYYEKLNTLVQEEPASFLGLEIKGQLASIGIVKGKPFAPDARMKKILTDAAAIGNGAARAISYFPRNPDNYFYDKDSAWTMAYAAHDTAFDKNGARHLDARVFMHFGYICVSPAMAVTVPGKGSDYAIAATDSKKQALDGAKTYKLHLPPNVPVAMNWSVTIYDSQTRSMLQTDQPNAGLNSQSRDVKMNADGSFDIYYGPTAPRGKESNWVQSVPGKSYFTVLRAYGPKLPWIDKTWRPSDLEPVK